MTDIRPGSGPTGRPFPGLARVDLGAIPYAEAADAMSRWVAECQSGAAGDRLFLLSHPPVVTYGPLAGARHHHGAHLARLPGHSPPERTRRAQPGRGVDPGQPQGRLDRHADPRRVSSHGFSVNVNPDMTVFGSFVSCGLAEPPTSLRALADEHGQARSQPGRRPGRPRHRARRGLIPGHPVRVGIAHHLGWAVAVTASAGHVVVDRRPDRADRTRRADGAGRTRSQDPRQRRRVEDGRGGQGVGAASDVRIAGTARRRSSRTRRLDVVAGVATGLSGRRLRPAAPAA